MSQIQSSVGLISGIQIQDTVNQLMELAARPRNQLLARTEGLKREQLALDQLGSFLLAFRLSATQLGTASHFSATTVTSSNPTALAASASGNVPPGTYSFTPLQQAAAHQVASTTLVDPASQLAGGMLELGFGGQVDRGIALSQLNAGGGFQPGKIRLTDRSGATAEIDLRTAQTIDDVLMAINGQGGVDVTASVEGDALVLTDHSGGSGNLRVREVGIGTTAASLGLGEIYVAADVATGSDIFSLHAATRLSTLNDGRGVRLRAEVDDLEISLADGTVLTVDFGEALTLGDVVEALNSQAAGKLSARIAADGNRLEVTDLTTGSQEFSITSIGLGRVAEDLGLTGTAVGGVITGGRLAAGLRDTLISSLRGGAGLGELGTLSIADRAGNPPALVDLSSAETLGDIVALINGSGAQVTAAINSSRSGITLVDHSGGNGHLTVTSADSSGTAESLGIAIDDQAGSVNSGSLGKQTVSETTLLSTLNGGRGVRIGSFSISNSNGIRRTLSLTSAGTSATTIGDVIDKINALDMDIEARINDTGDGILLTDLAGGTRTLTVSELSGGTTAADLQLLGASSGTNQADQQVINGATRFSIDLDSLEADAGILLSSLNDGNGITLGTFRVTDSRGAIGIVQLGGAGDEAQTIEDVIARINATGIGVTASLNAGGTGILLTDTAGGSGTLMVDDLGSGKSAAQLKIATSASTSGGTQTIDGGGLFLPRDSNQTQLELLSQRINDLKGGFTASTLYDGTGYRLSITANSPGAQNELSVGSSLAAFSFVEITRPQDAILQVGSSPTGGIVLASANARFEGVVPGLTTEVLEASESPVQVTVAGDDKPLVDSVQSFVDSFNSIRSTLTQLTSFDAEALTTGLLFGRSEVIRIETDLANLLTGTFSASSEIRSLGTIGLSLNDKGELEFNKTKFRSAYETNPAEVERLLTTKETGVIDRFATAIDRLAGEEASLLAARYDALNATIESNETRIASLDRYLERERERTLMEFYLLEETLAKYQANFAALDGIQAMQPLAIRANR